MEKWNGNFEMVDPAVIVIDHRYQRPEKETLIRRIAQSPDWEAFGAVSLYRRNGVLVCVDGQQRIRGVLTCENPPKEIPAIVFEKTTLDQEAETYVAINVMRTAVNALEKHKGLVVAKNPAALAIERAVEKAGYTVAGPGGGAGPRTIHAIGAIYHAYTQLAEEGLVQVLVQARDSWQDDPAGISVHMIRGLVDVLTDLGSDYHRGKLTTALQKSSPALIMRKAEELKFDLGGSKQTNVRRAIKVLCKV